jgi:hypothetical protein
MKLILVLFSIIFPVNIFAQSSESNVAIKLTSADSIKIVKHKLTTVNIYNEKTHKRYLSPQLLQKNKLNYAIIESIAAVDSSETKGLITILTSKNEDEEIKQMTCFLPHHAILIFKKGIVSYIDICFGCRKIATTEDIITNSWLSDKSWKELEKFFNNKKIKTKMTLKEFYK